MTIRQYHEHIKAIYYAAIEGLHDALVLKEMLRYCKKGFHRGRHGTSCLDCGKLIDKSECPKCGDHMECDWGGWLCTKRVWWKFGKICGGTRNIS